MLITALVIFLLMYAFEWRHVISTEITAWEQDPTVDCAVVLTGGPGRVKEGFALLSRKLVKKLIVSGVHPEADLRDIFPHWPFYGSLDEKDVILDRRSNTTYGNAQQSLAIVEALNCRDVAIITSRYHMYRALRTFQAAYPKSIPLVKHSISAGKAEPDLFEISTEVLKSLFYRIWAY